MFVENGICRPDTTETELLKVTGCQILGGKRLRVRFNTGDVRDADLTPLLAMPAFRPLETETVFHAFSIDHGIVCWQDGEIDLAPEWLFDHGIPVTLPGSATEPPPCRVAENHPAYGSPVASPSGSPV